VVTSARRVSSPLSPDDGASQVADLARDYRGPVPDLGVPRRLDDTCGTVATRRPRCARPVPDRTDAISRHRRHLHCKRRDFAGVRGITAHRPETVDRCRGDHQGAGLSGPGCLARCRERRAEDLHTRKHWRSTESPMDPAGPRELGVLLESSVRFPAGVNITRSRAGSGPGLMKQCGVPRGT